MFEGYEELTGQEQERMQEVIRQLFSQTFLLERKYEKKSGRIMTEKNYDFCERHMEFLTQYFSVAGIRLCQDTELGTIYIQAAEGIGEKLPKLATVYLLLLKLIYDEKMAAVSSSVNIITTFGELNGKAGEFRLVKGLSSMTEMKRAFAVLRKYQMIEFLDLMEELNENTRIMIYPCINLVLMREDIEGLLHSFEEEPDEREPNGERLEEPDGDGIERSFGESEEEDSTEMAPVQEPKEDVTEEAKGESADGTA